MEGVRRWWQELTGLVLPAACGGCGSARTVLCPQCRAALGGAVPFRVRPVPEPPGLPAVHAAARYADEVRAVLLAHKERGALALTRPLGAALAGAVRAGVREAGEGVGAGEGPPPPGGVLLVPVPSARAAVRARGHDPARRIALAAAGELRRAGVPARVAAVLRQRRAVADQAGLDSRQRLDNLVGALAVVPGGARVLCGGAVVLVDDLVTTGASLAEAARAVRSATAAERAECAERVGRVEGGVRVGEGAAWGGGAAAVYGGVSREDRDDRDGGVGRPDRAVEPSGAGEGGVGGVSAGVGGGGDVLCAAVVAASPGSLEINRN
ncbi:ComF family protein [Streptomyces sp. NPDC050263]|uniref:ComF family protein n=1 Tax=Streptomyces sp. NPDC050263 TaxID=3155037 RepID=UPI003424F5FE